MMTKILCLKCNSNVFKEDDIDNLLCGNCMIWWTKEEVTKSKDKESNNE